MSWKRHTRSNDTTGGSCKRMHPLRAPFCPPPFFMSCLLRKKTLKNIQIPNKCTFPCSCCCNKPLGVHYSGLTYNQYCCHWRPITRLLCAPSGRGGGAPWAKPNHHKVQLVDSWWLVHPLNPCRSALFSHPCYWGPTGPAYKKKVHMV